MKRLTAALIVAGFLAVACITPSCTTTTNETLTSSGTTSLSSTTVPLFTVAKSAEDVLKTAEKFRLSGEITDEQFAKVKAAYNALRTVERLIVEGRTGGTLLALSTKMADLAAAAAEIGVAFNTGGK